MRRSARIVVEVLVGIVAGLLILAGIGIWRLSSGPAEVDFLTPRLEAAFNDGREDVSLDIGETVLTWEGWGRTVDLRARNSTLTDADGSTLARLPDVSVTLSLRALIQGVIAPTAVEIIRPSLVLIRQPDGDIAFGHGDPDSGMREHELSRLLPVLVDQLQSAPDPARPLSFLDAVRLVDGRLTIHDETRGLRWRARGVSLELHSEEGALAGGGALKLVDGQVPADVKLAFLYDPRMARIELAGTFMDLHPEVFEALVPDPALLAGLDLAFKGKVNAQLAPDGSLEGATFEIGGGPGQFALGSLYPNPRPLEDLILRGVYRGPVTGLSIDAAEIRFGSPEEPGPTVSAAGDVYWLSGDVRVTGAARVTSLPVDQLADYWPQGVSENGREWIVENVTAGAAEEATLSLDLTLPAGELAAAEIGALTGTLRYRDLEVHYLRPMPPVTAVSGTATYNQSGMSFHVAGGKLAELDVLESVVTIEGFQQPDQHADMNVPITGSLSEMLSLLNHDRLRLMDRFEIDPQTTEGLAAARISFQFPLIDDLELDDVTIAAKANLTGVGIGDLALGQDARNGKLSLDLTENAMRIIGELVLGPLPIELDWTEQFSEEAPERSVIKVLASSVSEQQRAALGFDVWPGLTGPVSASAVAQLRRDDSASVRLAVNLADAELSVPFLKWEKPTGVAGEGRATLQIEGERLVGIEELSITADSLAVEGSGRLDQQGQFASADLQRLAIGETALRDVRIAAAQDGYEVTIGGGDLDVEPLLARTEDSDEAAEPAEAAEPPEEGPLAKSMIRLRAPALDRLRFAEGRYLSEVSLRLAHGPDGWQRLQLSGSIPPELRTVTDREDGAASEAQAPPVVIDYAPTRPNLHELKATANDLGGLLRALDLLEFVRGGRLEISGSQSSGEPLAARVEAREFTVTEAPVLARLLLIASLTGVLEGLRGDGISFQRLVGEVEVEDGVITSDLVRAYGNSLGLTAEGKLEIDPSRIDVEGTIVPAYLINRIIGEIPVLGPLLTGGEGQGVVAFTYTMKGPLAEPDISVNPLSVLAPGFLRNLFGGDFSEGKTPDLPSGSDR